jgi:flagellar hook-length control protein FliK
VKSPQAPESAASPATDPAQQPAAEAPAQPAAPEAAQAVATPSVQVAAEAVPVPVAVQTPVPVVVQTPETVVAAPVATVVQAAPAAAVQVAAAVQAAPAQTTPEAVAAPVAVTDGEQVAVPAGQQPAANAATAVQAQTSQPATGEATAQPTAQQGQAETAVRPGVQQQPPQGGKTGDEPVAPQADVRPAESKEARAENTLQSADQVRAVQSAASNRAAAPEAVANGTARTAAPVEAPVAQPANVEQAPAQAARADAPEHRPGVRLAQAVETVQGILRVAQSRGISHARLALNPAELGGVDVHLRSTAQGLVATVSADSVEAAQLLHQAGAELRRTLEGQGLNVARLDIGLASGEQRREARAFTGGAGEGGDRRPNGERGSVDGTEEVAVDTSETTLRLPNGVLVDVIA